ncbi:hypothetical protein JCM10213_006842 [Rhodosporidiobolus nylandii]
MPIPPPAPPRQPTPSSSSSSRDPSSSLASHLVAASSAPSSSLSKLNPASASFSFLQPDSVPQPAPSPAPSSSYAASASGGYDGPYPLGGAAYQQQNGYAQYPYQQHQQQQYYPISNYAGANGAQSQVGWAQVAASGAAKANGAAPWATQSPYAHHQQHPPHHSQPPRQQSPYFASHAPPPPPAQNRVPQPPVPPGGAGAPSSGSGGGVMLPLAHGGPLHHVPTVVAASGYHPAAAAGFAQSYSPAPSPQHVHARTPYQPSPSPSMHHQQLPSQSLLPPFSPSPVLLHPPPPPPSFSPAPPPPLPVSQQPRRVSSSHGPAFTPAPSLPASPPAPPSAALSYPSFSSVSTLSTSVVPPPVVPLALPNGLSTASSAADSAKPALSDPPSRAGRPIRRRRSHLPPPRDSPPVSVAPGLNTAGSEIPIAHRTRKGKERAVDPEAVKEVPAKEEKAEKEEVKKEAEPAAKEGKAEKPASRVPAPAAAPAPVAEAPKTPKQPARTAAEKATPAPAPAPATPAQPPKSATAPAPAPSTPASAAAAPPATPKSPSTPAAPPVKRSWADLVRPPPGSPGFVSINLSAPAAPYTASTPVSLLSLASAPSPPAAHYPSTPTPRGLVNNGNLCFANAVLQVLVWTGSFWNLMERVERGSKKALGGKEGEGGVVEAMIAFLAEFRNASPSLASQTASTSSSSTAPAFDPSVNHASSASAPSSAPSGSSTPGPTDNSSHFPAPPSSATASTFVEGAGPSLSPTPIHDALKPYPTFDAMRRGTQEDAEEFLGLFLDVMHEEVAALIEKEEQKAAAGTAKGKAKALEGEGDGWEEVGSKGRAVATRTTSHKESPISRIFGGKLRSVLRCPGQKDSVTIEPFQRLGLDIEPDHVHSVTDALNSLTAPESLREYTTSRGLFTKEATKTVLLDALPPVLILHLKRFRYDELGVQKNGKRIAYGTELKLDERVLSAPLRASVGKDGARYELFGVVYHHGLHASGGHYTVAVRRGYHSKEWLELDDTNIYPLTAEDVAVPSAASKATGGKRGWESAASLGVGDGDEHKNAYLLLYARVEQKQ